MRVLITGAAGFAGRHLADHLSRYKNVEMFGLVRKARTPEECRRLPRGVTAVHADLNSPIETLRILRRTRPDRIFHLAAESSVMVSWGHAERVITNNLIGQLHMFEAVRKLKLDPVIQVSGSAEEYGGAPKEEWPADERTLLRPVNPYAFSKAACSLLSYQYFKNFGLRIVTTRAFSQTGPGQNERFVASSFARQIALIERCKQKPIILVGNLQAVRDFTDVRDVVRAYWLAAEKGVPGEVYNVCSGKAEPVQMILDTLLELTPIRIKVKQDRARMRPHDVPILLGNDKKFFKLTGWKPQIPFRRTLSDLLNDWRRRVDEGRY